MLQALNLLQNQIVPIFTGRRYVEADKAHFEMKGDFKSGDCLLKYTYEEIDPRKLFGSKTTKHSGELRIRHKIIQSHITDNEHYAVLFNSVNGTREDLQKFIGGFTGITRFLAPYLKNVQGNSKSYFFYIENESDEMPLFYSLEAHEMKKYFWAKKVHTLEWAKEIHQSLRAYPPAGSKERIDYIFNNCGYYAYTKETGVALPLESLFDS